MVRIDVKGDIIPNDYQSAYDFFGFDGTSPQRVEAGLPTDGREVLVCINSPGGDVAAGIEIYSALRGYAGPVTVRVTGFACSAASMVAMAGDVVEMSPAAMMMVHNVSTSAQGDVHTMTHAADILQEANKAIAEAYVTKSGMALDTALALMDEETWLSAGRAVELGLADRVATFEDADALPLAAALRPLPSLDKLQQAMQAVQKDEQAAKQAAAEYELLQLASRV